MLRHTCAKIAPPRAALLACTALLALTTASHAQQALEPVTVYGASHVPLDAARVGSSVSVVTAKDIAEQGSQTLPDVLRTLPGVSVSATGGRGSITQVRVRGAEANHSLIIVDGVPLNNVADGDFDYANLPVADIERIEVVRGPQSGIYGPNAQSGVILITTKSGKGLAKPQLDARMELGTMGTVETSLSVRGSNGPAYGAVTVQGHRTNGYNTAYVGSRTDANSSFAASGKFGVDVTEWFNIESTLRFQSQRNDYHPQDNTGFLVDGLGTGTNETFTGRVAATMKALDGRWTHRVALDVTTSERRDLSAYDDAFFGPQTTNSWTKTERLRGEYRNALSFDLAALPGVDHTLISGIDIQRERFRTWGDFSGFIVNGYEGGVLRDRLGAFGEYIVGLPTGTTISAAVRHDWNRTFQNALTFRLTGSQKLTETTRLHASLGKGVTNPSFFEQFGFSNTFVGNPNLRPEQSLGWDIGIEQKFFHGALVADVTYFRANLLDEIAGAGISATNLPFETYRQGVEVTLTAKPTDWLSVSANYTYTDTQSAEDVLGTYVIKEALRRPRHAANAALTARFLDNKARFTLSAAYNGVTRDRFFGTFPATDVWLGAYSRIGAQISYDMSKSTTVYARAENLFNTQYEDVFSYRGAGVQVFAGMKLRLGQD